jgi:hypothetical protein
MIIFFDDFRIIKTVRLPLVIADVVVVVVVESFCSALTLALALALAVSVIVGLDNIQYHLFVAIPQIDDTRYLS